VIPVPAPLALIARLGPAAFIQVEWELLLPLLLLLLAQQLWIYLSARRSAKHEELFRIITENAADMIALVNVKGRRLYNSPPTTSARLQHGRARSDQRLRADSSPR
jgi:hypothetical protein